MKNNFDDFLKSEMEKSSYEFVNNGFSDRVILNLPVRRRYNYLNKRNIILFFTICAVIVFALINGINQITYGLYNFTFRLLNQGGVSSEFIIFVFTFSILTISISMIEFRHRAF